MTLRSLRRWVWFCGALSLWGCSSKDAADDDASAAGAANGGAGTGGSATSGGSAGTAGTPGSAGTTSAGGSTGGAGKAGGGGTAANGGSGGSAGGGGSTSVAGAGGGHTPAPPLAAADDPSRISALTDCALAQAGTCIVPITRTKDEVCTHWSSEWAKHAPAGYTLPDDRCAPAVLNADAQADTIRRINLYRWLSGLEPLTLDDGVSSTRAQACAVIQAHLDDINHYPPAESDCYTADGGAASSESLLFLGSYTPADSIDDLIFDWGQRNFHVLGHRWWLLNPGLKHVGLGFAFPSDGLRAGCVRVNDGMPLDRPAGLAGLVAFPSFGRVPYESIDREYYARPIVDPLEWFVTFPDDTDLTSASVRLYREGTSSYEPLAVTSGGVADFATLWLDPPKDPMAPGTYLVLVSGTALGEFGYRVIIDRCGSETAPLSCDVLTQDCDVAGYGCYAPGAGFCAKSGKLEPGAACLGDLPAECVEGSACVQNRQARDGFACAEYCDPLDQDAPKACSSLCLGSYILTTVNKTGETVGAYCEPGTGSLCDPLAPACPNGQSCYSWGPARCLTTGSIEQGEPCIYSNDCAPGLSCVSIDSTNYACSPYCSLTDSTSDDACDKVCPNDYFEVDDYAICLPE